MLAFYKQRVKKIPYLTVRRVILKFQNEKTTTRKSGAGKKTDPPYPENAAKVVRAFKRNPGLSVRDDGQLVGLSSTTVGHYEMHMVLSPTGFKTPQTAGHGRWKSQETL